MNHIPRGVVVLTAATVLLAGCSGADSGTDAAAAPDAAAASASAGSRSGAVPVPSASIVNQPVARKDVAMTSCAARPDGWGAGGSVSNSGNEPATYTIVVSFTDQHSTVLTRKTTTVTVPGKGRHDWAVQAAFAAPKDVVCVLRGVGRV